MNTWDRAFEIFLVTIRLILALRVAGFPCTKHRHCKYNSRKEKDGYIQRVHSEEVKDISALSPLSLDDGDGVLLWIRPFTN